MPRKQASGDGGMEIGQKSAGKEVQSFDVRKENLKSGV